MLEGRLPVLLLTSIRVPHSRCLSVMVTSTAAGRLAPGRPRARTRSHGLALSLLSGLGPRARGALEEVVARGWSGWLPFKNLKAIVRALVTVLRWQLSRPTDSSRLVLLIANASSTWDSIASG